MLLQYKIKSSNTYQNLKRTLKKEKFWKVVYQMLYKLNTAMLFVMYFIVFITLK